MSRLAPFVPPPAGYGTHVVAALPGRRSIGFQRHGLWNGVTLLGGGCPPLTVATNFDQGRACLSGCNSCWICGKKIPKGETVCSGCNTG